MHRRSARSQSIYTNDWALMTWKVKHTSSMTMQSPPFSPDCKYLRNCHPQKSKSLPASIPPQFNQSQQAKYKTEAPSAHKHYMLWNYDRGPLSLSLAFIHHPLQRPKICPSYRRSSGRAAAYLSKREIHEPPRYSAEGIELVYAPVLHYIHYADGSTAEKKRETELGGGMRISRVYTGRRTDWIRRRADAAAVGGSSVASRPVNARQGGKKEVKEQAPAIFSPWRHFSGSAGSRETIFCPPVVFSLTHARAFSFFFFCNWRALCMRCVRFFSLSRCTSCRVQSVASCECRLREQC